MCNQPREFAICKPPVRVPLADSNGKYRVDSPFNFCAISACATREGSKDKVDSKKVFFNKVDIPCTLQPVRVASVRGIAKTNPHEYSITHRDLPVE